MTVNEQAIDAAAEALFDESQELGQENSWDDPLPDEWRESWRDAAREALEAALPHIREQIADEIKAEGLLEAAAECWEGYEVTDNRGVSLWLERRAKELKGKS